MLVILKSVPKGLIRVHEMDGNTIHGFQPSVFGQMTIDVLYTLLFYKFSIYIIHRDALLPYSHNPYSAG